MTSPPSMASLHVRYAWTLHQSPIAYFYLGTALIQSLLQFFSYSNFQARST
jgi:hypothetical protein